MDIVYEIIVHPASISFRLCLSLSRPFAAGIRARFAHNDTHTHITTTTTTTTIIIQSQIRFNAIGWQHANKTHWSESKNKNEKTQESTLLSYICVALLVLFVFIAVVVSICVSLNDMEYNLYRVYCLIRPNVHTEKDKNIRRSSLVQFCFFSSYMIMSPSRVEQIDSNGVEWIDWDWERMKWRRSGKFWSIWIWIAFWLTLISMFSWTTAEECVLLCYQTSPSRYDINSNQMFIINIMNETEWTCSCNDNANDFNIPQTTISILHSPRNAACDCQIVLRLALWLDVTWTWLWISSHTISEHRLCTIRTMSNEWKLTRSTSFSLHSYVVRYRLHDQMVNNHKLLVSSRMGSLLVYLILNCYAGHVRHRELKKNAFFYIK